MYQCIHKYTHLTRIIMIEDEWVFENASITHLGPTTISLLKGQSRVKSFLKTPRKRQIPPLKSYSFFFSANVNFTSPSWNHSLKYIQIRGNYLYWISITLDKNLLCVLTHVVRISEVTICLQTSWENWLISKINLKKLIKLMNS